MEQVYSVGRQDFENRGPERGRGLGTRQVPRNLLSPRRRRVNQVLVLPVVRFSTALEQREDIHRILT